jgi:hypothetical protein
MIYWWSDVTSFIFGVVKSSHGEFSFNFLTTALVCFSSVIVFKKGQKMISILPEKMRCQAGNSLNNLNLPTKYQPTRTQHQIRTSTNTVEVRGGRIWLDLKNLFDPFRFEINLTWFKKKIKLIWSNSNLIRSEIKLMICNLIKIYQRYKKNNI